MRKFDAEAAERGRQARAEVERRVLAAIDRLDVALQFTAPSPGVMAQVLHGIHYLERGWAGSLDQHSIPPDAPDFRIEHDDAEALAQNLINLLADARHAKGKWGERA